MSLSFEPKLQAEWDWDKLDTKWEVGAEFSGYIDIGINLDMVFTGNNSLSGGPYILYRKVNQPIFMDETKFRNILA